MNVPISEIVVETLNGNKKKRKLVRTAQFTSDMPTCVTIDDNGMCTKTVINF